jgi:hypothetical protein
LELSSSECVLVGKLQAGSKVFNLAGLYLLNDDSFFLVGASSNGDFYTIEGEYNATAPGNIQAGSAKIGGNVEGAPIAQIDVSGVATPPTIGEVTETPLPANKQIHSALQGEWLLCEGYQDCQKLVVTALGIGSYEINNAGRWAESGFNVNVIEVENSSATEANVTVTTSDSSFTKTRITKVDNGVKITGANDFTTPHYDEYFVKAYSQKPYDISTVQAYFPAIPLTTSEIGWYTAEVNLKMSDCDKLKEYVDWALSSGGAHYGEGSFSLSNCKNGKNDFVLEFYNSNIKVQANDGDSLGSLFVISDDTSFRITEKDHDGFIASLPQRAASYYLRNLSSAGAAKAKEFVKSLGAKGFNVREYTDDGRREHTDALKSIGNGKVLHFDYHFDTKNNEHKVAFDIGDSDLPW